MAIVQGQQGTFAHVSIQKESRLSYGSSLGFVAACIAGNKISGQQAKLFAQNREAEEVPLAPFLLFFKDHLLRSDPFFYTKICFSRSLKNDFKELPD